MRKIHAAAAAAAALCLMSSCGRIDEINGAELAETLIGSVAFSERLTEIDDAAAEKRFFLNPGDYTDITAYVGTTAACDEFAIIKTNDTESVKNKLSGHLSIQNTNYSSYRPAEAEKIQSAVIAEYGDAVVLIVSGDSGNALAVYEEYLKK